jgi:hypothetical protein
VPASKQVVNPANVPVQLEGRPGRGDITVTEPVPVKAPEKVSTPPPNSTGATTTAPSSTPVTKVTGTENVPLVQRGGLGRSDFIALD